MSVGMMKDLSKFLARDIVKINRNLALIEDEKKRLKVKDGLHFWLAANSNDERSIRRQIELTLKTQNHRGNG